MRKIFLVLFVVSYTLSAIGLRTTAAADNTRARAAAATQPATHHLQEGAPPETVELVFPDLDWLRVSKTAARSWTITPHPRRQNWRLIKPLVTPKQSQALYHILIIVSKRSKSYRLAVSELLNVFAEQQVAAQFTVINIGKDVRLSQAAVAFASEHTVDLIFSAGSESAGFMSRLYSAGSIPVVTSTNKDPVLLGQVSDYESGSGTNIAYTSLNVPLSIQADYLLKLKPNLKVIGLLYNTNHKQVMSTEVIPGKKEFKKLGIHTVDITVSSRKTSRNELEMRFPEALKKIKEIDKNMQNSILWITSSTAIFSNMDIIARYSGDIPALASIPNAVTEGDDSAVIAIGIDRRNNAHLAALYAVDILKNGTDPGILKVGLITPPDVSINFRIAKKLGLKIPFEFIEHASFIYDYSGKPIRAFGQSGGSKD